MLDPTSWSGMFAQYGRSLLWAITAAIGFGLGVGISLKVFDWRSLSVEPGADAQYAGPMAHRSFDIPHDIAVLRDVAKIPAHGCYPFIVCRAQFNPKQGRYRTGIADDPWQWGELPTMAKIA